MSKENHQHMECSEKLKGIKCKSCKHCLEANGVKYPQHLHCKHYDDELKPLDVAFGDKDCEFYEG